MPVLRMRRQLHFEPINVVAELFGVTMGRLDRLVVGHVTSVFMHVDGMGVTNMSGRGIVEGHDLRGDDPRRFSGVHKQRLIHGAHFYETESQKNALNSPMAFTL